MNENIKQLYEDKEKTIEAFPRVWMPIGSLYWNENDISDDIDKYFIGEWERVQDVFILAAGTQFVAGSKGGEVSHTLTIGEMPRHNHSVGGNGGSNEEVTTTTSDACYNKDNIVGGGSIMLVNPSSSANQITGNYITHKGANKPHNNMPPYEAFYCWKRIS